MRFVRQDSLFRYETMQTEDFMRRWLGKIQNRGRQRYVLIEVPRIRIDDSNIPKTITLTLNDNLADTKTYIQSNKQRKVSWSVPPNTVLLEYSLHTNCIKNYRLAST